MSHGPRLHGPDYQPDAACGLQLGWPHRIQNSQDLSAPDTVGRHFTNVGENLALGPLPPIFPRPGALPPLAIPGMNDGGRPSEGGNNRGGGGDCLSIVPLRPPLCNRDSTCPDCPPVGNSLLPRFCQPDGGIATQPQITSLAVYRDSPRTWILPEDVTFVTAVDAASPFG